MNREDIIAMAVDAGIIPWTKHEYVGGNNFSASDEGLDGDLASLIQFAALVASAEREACAKVCDSYYESWINIHGRYEFMGEGAQECATAIRARGDSMTSRTHTPEDVQKIMKPWVGLTEAQCGVLWKTNMTPFEYYQAIEAKLKEKNT